MMSYGREQHDDFVQTINYNSRAEVLKCSHILSRLRRNFIPVERSGNKSRRFQGSFFRKFVYGLCEQEQSRVVPGQNDRKCNRFIQSRRDEI